MCFYLQNLLTIHTNTHFLLLNESKTMIFKKINKWSYFDFFIFEEKIQFIYKNNYIL